MNCPPTALTCTAGYEWALLHFISLTLIVGNDSFCNTSTIYIKLILKRVFFVVLYNKYCAIYQEVLVQLTEKGKTPTLHSQETFFKSCETITRQ